MRHVIILAVLQCVIFMVKSFSYSDCTLFDSHMGATFGLNELKRYVIFISNHILLFIDYLFYHLLFIFYRNADQPPYIIEDGDLPCTTKVHTLYQYQYLLYKYYSIYYIS